MWNRFCSSSGMLFGEFKQDIRFGLRQLALRKWNAATIIFILALCVGANAAVYKWYKNVMLESFPFPNIERVLHVGHMYSANGDGSYGMCIPSFNHVKEHATSFEKVALIETQVFTLKTDGAPMRISGSRVTESGLEIMGARLLMGRFFSPESFSFGNSNEVVLSHRLWEKELNKDPNALGSSITINGHLRVVVGVMNKGFVAYNSWAQFWIPFAFSEQERYFFLGRRGDALALLKEGVSVEAANEELKRVLEISKEAFPRSVPTMEQFEFFYAAKPVMDKLLNENYSGMAENLKMFQGSVALVMLIGCLNVAALLAVRFNARMGEFAIKASLGASRSRLIRQLLTESFLFVLTGGLIGLFVAEYLIRLLIRFEYFFSPFTMIEERSYSLFDAGILGFVFALSFGILGFIGSISTFRIYRMNLVEPSNAASSRSSMGKKSVLTGNFFVVGQFALTCSLLIGALVLVSSFSKILKTDTGFESQGKTASRLILSSQQYSDHQAISQFIVNLKSELAGKPGIESVTVTQKMPFVDQKDHIGISLDGKDRESGDHLKVVVYYVIDKEFLNTLGISLREGRNFETADMASGAKLILVDKGFAEAHYPGENVVGKRIAWSDIRMYPPEALANMPWYTIVGVISDFNHSNLMGNADEQRIFFLHEQYFFNFETRKTMTVVIESKLGTEQSLRTLREAVEKLDSGIAIENAASLETHFSNSMNWQRRQLILMMSLAGLAVLLSAASVYGSIMGWVLQRRKEIGIRLALGASSGVVGWSILHRGGALIAIGSLIGCVGAYFLIRFIPQVHVDTNVHNPLLFIGGVLLLVVVSIPALLYPMYSALRINPLDELRCD